MRFTDKYLQGIKPKLVDYRVFEKGTDKGFGIKITAAGAISFFMQYAFDGKRRFYNLGRYPSVSLADARERCRETRLIIDKGIDPQSAGKEVAFGSVKDLLDNYINNMELTGKKTSQEVKYRVTKDCANLFDLPANTITPIHIRNILHTIIKRGSEVEANRVRAYLHRMFVLGIHHDHDPKMMSNKFTFNLSINPVDAVPKNQAAESIGDRALTFAEIKLLWNDTTLSPQFSIAVKLLLLYGGRSSEVIEATKEELDFKAMVWALPPARTKNKKWLLLPITPLAKQLFDDLWPYTRNSPFLFPGRYSDDKPINQTSLGHAISKITCIDKFIPRDLRRTVKTRMGEIGIEKSMRDRIQNHALNDVSSTHYDRYDYLIEKRNAILKWEKSLIELESTL